MLVRAMRDDEVDATVSVWSAARSAGGDPPTAARVARVREKLAEPGVIVRVAEQDGRIAGMLLAEPGRADDGAGAALPWLIHVSMLFVDPAARRSGMGQALLRHLFEEARRRGTILVGLWTNVDNAPARRLYESVGMTATRIRQLSPNRRWVRYEWSPLDDRR